MFGISQPVKRTRKNGVLSRGSSDLASGGNAHVAIKTADTVMYHKSSPFT